MSNKRQQFLKLLVGKDNEFLYANQWFLQLAVNMNMYTENDQINFTYKGTIPNVTKNPTYPLTLTNRTDTPDFIKLIPYASDEFIIPKIDLHALPYDKRASLLQDYRDAVMNEVVSEGIWNSSLYEDTADTPTVVATGAADANGNKLVTGNDIIALRKRLDKRYPGLKNAAWHLVLDVESYWAIAATDPIIIGQQTRNGSVGNVNTLGINYHGFVLHCDDRTPWYGGATDQRLAYGATPTLGTDSPSATAFVANRSFCSAIGSIDFFDNPRQSDVQADKGSFLIHAYVGAMSNDLETNIKYMGAILRKV